MLGARAERGRTARSVLALTRQNLPQLRTDAKVNRCAAGAYELIGAEGGDAQVSIFATGSEVEVAVGAHKLLAEKGISARVVSVPCYGLFLAQPKSAQEA